MPSDPNPAQPDGGTVLKACPFCGNTNIDPREWASSGGRSGPGCGVCGALGESAAAWNTRAPTPLASPEREAVCRMVLDELQRATSKFPTWPTDPLHAVCVLGEEFGELQKAVLQHTYEPHKSTLADVRGEAIQTGAMALRFLLSLDSYEYTRCSQHTQDAARKESSDAK